MPSLLRRISLHGLALSLAAALSATAADPANANAQTPAKVVLFAVPETIWQTKLEGRYRDHADLHKQLEERVRQGEAAREVEALCGLRQDGKPFEWKRGETRKFTTGWQVLDKGLGVQPEKFAEEFIGTTVGITDERARPDGTSTVELALQHHTAPPAMRRINFAQAAEGAERDRLSVEYPAFTKLEWRGRTALSHGWRLVAQMWQAPGENEGGEDKAVPALRHLLFTSAADADAGEDDTNATLEVRQAVIRAPELEVVEIMADTTTALEGTRNSTEASRIAALWQAVKEGRARVISDLTSAAAEEGGGVSMKQGRHVWLPTELEQDTDRLQMPPLSHGEYFVGTALECAGTGMTFQWKGVCVPRGPALVKWPVSWLNLWAGQKPDPQKRLIRGWLDFHDTFRQETLGSVTLRGPRMQILAIMPPADQVFPASPGRAAAGPGRWLDVFLAQVKAPGQEVPAGPEADAPPGPAPAPNPAQPLDPFAPLPRHLPKAAKPLPQGQANMFHGISIGAAEAATLLRRRDPAQDAALLEKLVARVRAGTARLRFCAGSGHDLQSRTSLTSARLHQVPVEMPSIPSAWNDRPIGTSLEMEFQDFALHQDLAPPGRSEWKLALDDPQAVMWQPRPRFFTLQGATPTMRGTHLVGLLQIPEIMRQQPDSGLDSKEPESILIFAQYHGGHALTGNANANDDSEHPPFEAELIVLEMPGTSVDDFQGLPGDPQPGEEEDERFSQLMSRVPTGEVRVAAHTLVTGRSGRIKAIIGEEHQHATEFDPPDNGTPRMRPTALETVNAGTEVEMEVAIHNAPPFEIHVGFTFKHSLRLPIEPGLPATLAIAARDESGPYPFGEHPQETWTSSDTPPATTGSSGCLLRDNQPLCLGARKPPGVERRVIHVAYLRVRRL